MKRIIPVQAGIQLDSVASDVITAGSKPGPYPDRTSYIFIVARSVLNPGSQPPYRGTGQVSPGQSSVLRLPLRVTEIFYSLQGETSRVGLPTLFIRLTGCPLRCQYCDTGYAFHGGEVVTIARILDRAKSHATRYVTVTGGEPLAQENCLVLLDALVEHGYSVSLETSGALDVSRVNRRVSKILDVKTPGSGEAGKNRWENLAHLASHDEIKFVLCDASDYEWAKQVVVEKNLAETCTVLFSPSYHELPAKDLADWILRDRLPVRMQVQLHKFLWGDMRGR